MADFGSIAANQSYGNDSNFFNSASDSWQGAGGWQSSAESGTDMTATQYQSQTPNSINNAKPDFFSTIFQGLANGIGQAVPAFLNTASTNLANRITQPTVKGTGNTTARVQVPLILGLQPTTWVIIGAIIVGVVFFVKK